MCVCVCVHDVCLGNISTYRTYKYTQVHLPSELLAPPLIQYIPISLLNDDLECFVHKGPS